MELWADLMTGLIITAVFLVGFFLSITKKEKGFYGGGEDDN